LGAGQRQFDGLAPVLRLFPSKLLIVSVPVCGPEIIGPDEAAGGDVVRGRRAVCIPSRSQPGIGPGRRLARQGA